MPDALARHKLTNEFCSMSALAGPLAEIWERRPADKKFKLGCVMHDAWTVKWIDAVEPFLRRQSFMFLYLSEQ